MGIMPERNSFIAIVIAYPLRDLTAFWENAYPVIPFFPLRWKVALHFMKAIGKFIHVSYQKWGVWGPLALSYFLYENNETRYGQDSKLFFLFQKGILQHGKQEKVPFFYQANSLENCIMNMVDIIQFPR